MNFLKKGPEIKLSEIKVPGFLQDVYYDLKDRHLLPLAAILLLAIVVVPFALAKSSGGGEAGDAGGGATAATATGGGSGESSELVAKSAPGLRDYRRRLDHLKSKNPFRQQYRRSESSTGGGTSSGGESSTSTTPATETAYESEVSYEAGGSGGSSGSGESGTGTPGRGTWYSYAIDVKVTTGSAESNSLGVAGNDLSSDGGSESRVETLAADGKPQLRQNLPELTMLPSREAPALTYMGSTRDGKKALMLVSSDVSGLFGDARCVIGSATCQLLALEVGLPETVVYGGNERVFKIEVVKIHLVASDKIKKAPIGKPHKHPEG